MVSWRYRVSLTKTSVSVLLSCPSPFGRSQTWFKVAWTSDGSRFHAKSRISAFERGDTGRIVGR
eukprot:5294467-Pyramimonas_sp.AAC.1